MSKKIWSSSDIKNEKSYFLQLCQDENGLRYFDLGVQENGFQINPECYFTTSKVDNELLALRAASLQAISAIYSLSNGSRFFLDPHNIWLTESEMKQLHARIPWLDVIWSTPVPPKFPPA